MCDSCAGRGDIALADDPYKEVAGENPTPPSASGSWEFVDCPRDFASGPITAMIKMGANEFWWPFQPDNVGSEVTSVEITIQVREEIMNSQLFS